MVQLAEQVLERLVVGRLVAVVMCNDRYIHHGFRELVIEHAGKVSVPAFSVPVLERLTTVSTLSMIARLAASMA